ncbi:MAG: hypothetical protein KBB33_02795 [Candidatus Cloacimonetes bacterium]|nr:hypothetical protein [Candidatus Cloacimonadota bacterium]HOH59535.1 hypothetical protein [Candidatus Cloacimonadota bacterium]
MKHPYTGILSSLDAVKDTLLQVCVYHDILGEYGAVVVLDDTPDQQLDKLAGLAQFAKKKAVMLPLIVSRSFIVSSLDSYPLEFINIISSDKENLMCMEDLLSNLQFGKADVRLQMEREFKSKWLLTRQSTLEAAGRSRHLRETLRMSVRAIIPAIKGFFFLAGHPYPHTLDQLLDQAELITGIDLKILGTGLREQNIGTNDVQRYLSILQRLIDFMESYQGQ